MVDGGLPCSSSILTARFVCTRYERQREGDVEFRSTLAKWEETAAHAL